jgi:hypothetical protein
MPVGWFDYRSVVSMFDLRSTAFLKGHGVTRVTAIQSQPEPQPDLLDILLEFQTGAFRFSGCQLGHRGARNPSHSNALPPQWRHFTRSWQPSGIGATNWAK